MSTISEMQSRLATAKERNRANNERRQEVMAEIKEKFGCDSLEELKAKVVELEAELSKQKELLEQAIGEAEVALVQLEQKVGVK